MTHQVLAVYLTFPDAASAERVATALLDARLAACVNVLPGVRSYYRWEGAVQIDDELVAIVKTTRDRLAALTALVRAEHPHDLPCVVAYHAQGGLDGYLAWVADETRSGPA